MVPLALWPLATLRWMPPLLVALAVWLMALPALAQTPRPHQALFLKARAGLSSYLGDNNTTPLNPDAFRVAGKMPYSVGGEVGVQLNRRWSLGLGFQLADYPIITRFYADLPVADHSTTRRTFQLLVRHRFTERRASAYLHAGYHLTFGEVTIFEAERLRTGIPFNRQRHYIHGPLLGLGIDLDLGPRLSVFAEATTHATLMDDSVDGRLPLGPPLPTNLREINRFGTFDLLTALNLGLLVRVGCRPSCDGGTAARRPPPTRSGRGLARVTHTAGETLTTLSYQYSLPNLRRLFLGIEGGLMPRTIYARYTFADGRQSRDETHFTGSFLGAAARLFPLGGPGGRFAPHLGITMALPLQAHLMAGADVGLGPSLTLGVEARYAHCPTHRQVFHKAITYRTRRVCAYRYGVSLALGYRL